MISCSLLILLCSTLNFFLPLFPNNIKTFFFFSKAFKFLLSLLLGKRLPPAFVSILILLKKSLVKLFSSDTISSPESSLGCIIISLSFGACCVSFFSSPGKFIFQSAKRYILFVSSSAFGGLATLGKSLIFTKGFPKQP